MAETFAGPVDRPAAAHDGAASEEPRPDDAVPERSWRRFRRASLDADYKQISDYGLIGDQRTAALVGMDGSIDWLCLPRFDSSSVFAALLDREKGGRWELTPDYDSFESTQHYDGPTNILVTEFRTDTGSAQVVDFMPCFKVRNVTISSGEVHRRVVCLSGEFRFRVRVDPRMDYGRIIPDVTRIEGTGYSFSSGKTNVRQQLSLITPLAFRMDRERGGLATTLVLSDEARERRPAREATLVMRYGPSVRSEGYETYSDVKFRSTRSHWKRWISGCTYDGPWKELVQRSALTLGLLFYSPTGAIIAAPTTSLPEEVGGVRNWDYRFSWIRDSSFVLWALHSIGIEVLEETYLDWLTSIFYLTAGNMQVMLGINGERDLTEQDLEHLEGYKGSKPVRTGNGAWDQFQLDVYGLLLDALYFSHKHAGGVDPDVYLHLIRPIIASVERDWQKPDRGIWEVRGEPRHFVYSKMWCWVAVDRAISIAKEIGMYEDIKRWSLLRETIRDTILERGWSDELSAFVRSFGSETLDAANLLMPQVGFLRARDWRVRATIDATISHLMTKGKFVHRYYDPDGLPGREGCFLACSFWLANCLTLSGRLKEAGQLLESLVGCANHLGLYSEEIDPRDGSMLGNFPQAFTHMGFIVSAVNYEAARRRKQGRKVRTRPTSGSR